MTNTTVPFILTTKKGKTYQFPADFVRKIMLSMISRFPHLFKIYEMECR